MGESESCVGGVVGIPLELDTDDFKATLLFWVVSFAGLGA